MTGPDEVRRAAAPVHAAREAERKALDHLKQVVLAGFAEGLTPVQLATATGVSRQTIYNWLPKETDR